MLGEYVKLPLISETVTTCTETLPDEPDEPQEPPEPDIDGGPPPMEGAQVATAFVEQTDSVTVIVIIEVSVTEIVSTICVFWFQPVV